MILEQSKFTKGTVVYEMLGDVEALLIEGGRWVRMWSCSG